MVAQTVATDERLLRALAEQLKLPLLQIARTAELADPTELAKITQIADMALQMIDGFLLSEALHAQQGLHLEPVTISSVLYEASRQLTPIARLYECDIELDVIGTHRPIMGDAKALVSAFTILGFSFLESLQATKTRRIVLAAHRTGQGVSAGVFSANNLTGDMFRRAKALFGDAKQPLANNDSAGTGVFIADSLLGSMGESLRVSQHQKLYGLAATLTLSQQLRLV